MIHLSVRSRLVCTARYSLCGTSPPPGLYLIRSSECNGRLVICASSLASVDLPPPALPNTATRFIRPPQRSRPPFKAPNDDSTEFRSSKSTRLPVTNQPPCSINLTNGRHN